MSTPHGQNQYQVRFDWGVAGAQAIGRDADVGIDYCSPESAAASASFTGLINATSHLISSSASGQALGRPPVQLDAVDEVKVLREFSVRA